MRRWIKAPDGRRLKVETMLISDRVEAGQYIGAECLVCEVPLDEGEATQVVTVKAASFTLTLPICMLCAEDDREPEVTWGRVEKMLMLRHGLEPEL
jgi:hypothetical protein